MNASLHLFELFSVPLTAERQSGFIGFFFGHMKPIISIGMSIVENDEIIDSFGSFSVNFSVQIVCEID
jgi:uncharacterized protein YjfI (DUF2170 family)